MPFNGRYPRGVTSQLAVCAQSGPYSKEKREKHCLPPTVLRGAHVLVLLVLCLLCGRGRRQTKIQMLYFLPRPGLHTYTEYAPQQNTTKIKKLTFDFRQ